ncbi:MAG: restriction endonuclease subunit R, partial [Candidatus Aenigmatarchaeota archaeon]
PSWRVIMRDLKRYQPGIGAVFVSVLDVQQMLGRAGRPQYDDFGEGIILSKSEEEAEEIIEYYIYGESEEIQSKLAAEPALRMHILALIANEFCKTEKSLLEFFSKTFFAYQYGNISLLEEKILEVLEMLEKWRFVEKKKDKLHATRIGRRVSELYIDPLTAHHFIQCLGRAKKKEIQPFSFLQVICNTIEMRPLLSIRTGEFSELNEKIAERENLLLQKVPEEWDLEFDDFLKSVKTALMFESWINEASEDDILTKFRVVPGEFYSRKHVADWLIYSLQELALLLGYKELLKEIRKLRIRLEYGVKEELLPLVRLRNIGRRRARILYSSNLRSLNDLRRIPYESLSRIVGPKIAKSIKDQLERKGEVEHKEISQASLTKFK